MPRDKHWIDLDSATQLTAQWRRKYPKYPKAMGFNRAAFERILKQKGCKGIRSYFAMKSDGSWTLVLVGTDYRGRDITNGEIAEESLPCPPWCDNESPLGSSK
jgi:hypothetical protein